MVFSDWNMTCVKFTDSFQQILIGDVLCDQNYAKSLENSAKTVTAPFLINLVFNGRQIQLELEIK